MQVEQETTIQGSSSQAQTQNPQQAPADLQPNVAGQSSLQNVRTQAEILSNPQDNAIITIPGTSQSTAASLVANDALTDTSGSAQPTIGITIIALVIVSSSFLLVRKITQDN